MHYKTIEECPVSTAGPDYYIIPAGCITDHGLLCLIGLKEGDTLDVLKMNCVSSARDGKSLLGLVFVKVREDDESQIVFKSP